jgi:type II secretory pathway pseudopilin PulG
LKRLDFFIAKINDILYKGESEIVERSSRQLSPDKLGEEVIKNMPGWFYVMASVIILIILIIIAGWTWLGAKRFADGIRKENRLLSLHDELNTQRQQNGKNEGVASQLLTSVENADVLLKSMIDLRVNQYLSSTEYLQHIQQQGRALIQRAVDALASDIKFRPGERHRCGYWAAQEGQLRIEVASAGFPDYYIGERLLEIDNSIAGRSFRKREVIKVDSVGEDVDWQRNSKSSSPYKAIICIPVVPWGVLTIDALNPMNEEVKSIGQLYARIIEGAINESFIALQLQGGVVTDDVAAASHDDNYPREQ